MANPYGGLTAEAENRPPITMPPFHEVSARTSPKGSFTTPSTSTQFAPFHRASYSTASGPALSKYPPANNSPWNNARSYTLLSVPGPPPGSADHAVPFHRAILLTVVVPATGN